MTSEQKQLVAAMRQYLIGRDTQAHPLREFAFNQWREATVWSQAVNRWIAEIGARA